MSKFLIDTNVIIHYPDCLKYYNDVVIHLKTIEELDRLKTSLNGELAYRVRKAINCIEKKTFIDLTIQTKTYNKEKTDDVLLICAKNKNYVLVTNDLSLLLRAKFEGVETSKYKNGDFYNYSGILEKRISSFNNIDSELLKLKDRIKRNEFVIFKNNQSEIKIFKKDDEFKIVDNKSFYNSINRKIQPKNPEQKCLFESLSNNNIKIIVVTGGYGVGKSYLTVNYAFQELEKGVFNKIVYVPNNSFVANSREIGALPGDLFEKELIHMGALCDIITQDEVERRIGEGTLELMPISVARGRNLEDCLVLVSEAQNLTEEHVKLLIGRTGENSRIIFDGDIKQSDKSIFKNSSGIKLLYKIRDSEFNDLFSAIKLKNIERSRTSRVSDYLDSVE